MLNRFTSPAADYADAIASKLSWRMIPPQGTPHGFYQPYLFMLHRERNRWRRLLYWIYFARFKAKAVGGSPRLEHILPPDLRSSYDSHELIRRAFEETAC